MSSNNSKGHTAKPNYMPTPFVSIGTPSSCVIRVATLGTPSAASPAGKNEAGVLRTNNLQTLAASAVSCLFCDHTPNIPADAMANISSLFRENGGFIQNLSSLGIHNDKHIQVLKMWGAEDFLEFIQVHPDAEVPLGTLHKDIFLWYFTPYRQQQDSLCILEPSLEVKNHLINGCFDESPLYRIDDLVKNAKNLVIYSFYVSVLRFLTVMFFSQQRKIDDEIQNCDNSMWIKNV